MAKNTKLYKADNLRLEVGSGVESGDPVAVGEIVGVALTDANDDNIATIRTTGSANFDVTGNDGTDDTAVEVGDVLYLQDDDSIDLDDAGTRFGYALQEVTSGETAEIEVKIGY